METGQIHAKIGRNLQTIRKSRSLSLDQVAELTGVSKAMIGQIERGDSNPTITILWKIVNGLHLSFTSLIEDEMAKVRIIRQKDLVPFEAENGLYRSYPVIPFDQQKQFEVYALEIEPGCVHYSEPHNAGVEEYIFVNRGELILTIQEEICRLGPGDSLHFTADIPHTYENRLPHLTSCQVIIYYPS